MTSAELLYIKTVAEEKSITKAAGILHISQPSLTQAISKVEAELGTPLFRRSSGGTVPTPAGKLYCEMAADILSRYQQFLDALAISPSLSVGASWYITTSFLSPLAGAFCARYPRTELVLTEKNSSGLESLFREGKLDCILTHSCPYEDAPVGKQLHTEILASEYFCAAAPVSLALSSRAVKKEGYRNPVLPLEAVSDIPCVFFHKDQKIRQLTEHVFRQARIQPPALLSTYGFQSALDAAVSGQGFVLLPEHFLSMAERPDIEILDLDRKWNFYWNIRFTCRQQDLTGIPEKFLQLLRTYVAQTWDCSQS